jgi:hypothetical protein
LATTLGVAVGRRHVALVLVEQRRTGTVTLDRLLLDAADSAMTPSADVPLHVLAEVQRTITVLDAHKRPLSQVAVTATEPASASTAARVVEALTEAGVRNTCSIALQPNDQPLANTRPGNIGLPTDRTEDATADAVVTAAHEIALEAQARSPDADGHALSGRKRRVMALAATALATIGVGLFGFRSLHDQSGTEVTPVEATDPVPTQVTRHADPPPTTVETTKPSPPVVADTTAQVAAPPEPADVAVPAQPAPTAAPIQNSPPSTVEPTPSPSETVPQAPEPAPVTTSQAAAEPPAPPPPASPAAEPPAAADQHLSGPAPPGPADPQATPTPP